MTDDYVTPLPHAKHRRRTIAEQVDNTVQSHRLNEGRKEGWWRDNWLEIIEVMCVLVGLAGWVVYVVFVVREFYDAKKHPTTSVTFDTAISQDLPQLTICNWNSNLGNCSYCTLNLIYCHLNNPDGTTPDCDASTYEYKEIYSTGGLYRCYIFNYNKTNIVERNTTGYSGSVSFLFSINPVNTTLAPDGLFGLQISFTVPGQQADVFNETNYIATGFDTFYTIQKILETYLPRPSGEQQPDRARWSSVTSLVKLYNDSTPDGQALVGVSVGYLILPKEIIAETVVQDEFGVFADLMGVLVLLSGLSLLRFCNLIWAVPYTIIMFVINKRYEWKPIHKAVT